VSDISKYLNFALYTVPIKCIDIIPDENDKKQIEKSIIR
jgi:hypothetical protein